MTDVATPAVTPAPAGPSVRRPLKSRYLIVVLLPLVAVVAGVLWAFAVADAAAAHGESYPRSDIPGTITLEPRVGSYVVYSEGASRDFTVRVLAPDGTQVAVEALQSGSVYEIGGTMADAVASFDVPTMTSTGYTVEAVGTADPQGSFAVGDDDLIGWARANQIAAVSLLVVNVGAAIAIAVVPLVRYRRQRVAVPG